MNDKERKLLDSQKVGGPVQIVGILSNKNYQMIQNGEASIEIPSGIVLHNRAGSKELLFECDDEKIAEDLINGLENSGIPWHEDFESEEVGLEDIAR